VAWVALLTTLSAVAVLLHRTIELSERRGRFVSAVTHELRTPLTTFCMYSEMLAEGVVREEESVREYLGTLRSEAARLRRIVDNVLLYARVEGDGRAPAHERVGAVELLEGIVPALARRAEEAGFELAAELTALPDEAVVEVDGQAVEQILGNLVDNACKFAASAEDRRVHLVASARGGALRILVRDHGPGVPPGRERSIFDAFQRATGDQSGRIPGIGLGLTLSRGMARQMDGELSLVPPPDGGRGAAFDLKLPLLAVR
jgi:signal transduction histidine kinase